MMWNIYIDIFAWMNKKLSVPRERTALIMSIK